MAEDPRHDRQLLALLEAERRACVAKVMEMLAREAGLRQRRMEPMRDVRCVEGPTSGCREDVVLVVPAWPGREPFLGLPVPVLAERGGQLAAEPQCLAGSLRLRFGELAGWD